MESGGTVDKSVWMEVETLRRANVAGLREKYREVFGEETRSRHREHLFRRIAWRLQARAEGDLSARGVGPLQCPNVLLISPIESHPSSVVLVALGVIFLLHSRFRSAITFSKQASHLQRTYRCRT